MAVDLHESIWGHVMLDFGLRVLEVLEFNKDPAGWNASSEWGDNLEVCVPREPRALICVGGVHSKSSVSPIVWRTL